MPDPSHYLPTLNAGRWFAQLPREFAQALLHMAKLRTLQTGDVLFLRDSPPCGLYALVSGAVRISGQSGQRNEGREALLIVLTPPQWFGEISVFDTARRAPTMCTPPNPAPCCTCHTKICWRGCGPIQAIGATSPY